MHLDPTRASHRGNYVCASVRRLGPGGIIPTGFASASPVGYSVRPLRGPAESSSGIQGAA